jgi:hypothetical protein
VSLSIYDLADILSEFDAYPPHSLWVDEATKRAFDEMMKAHRVRKKRRKFHRARRRERERLRNTVPGLDHQQGTC